MMKNKPKHCEICGYALLLNNCIACPKIQNNLLEAKEESVTDVMCRHIQHGFYDYSLTLEEDFESFVYIVTDRYQSCPKTLGKIMKTARTRHDTLSLLQSIDKNVSYGGKNQESLSTNPMMAAGNEGARIEDLVV